MSIAPPWLRSLFLFAAGLAAVASAADPAFKDDECDDTDLQKACNFEIARGVVFEADDAFALIKGQGRLLFRRAKEGEEVQGAVVRVSGFGLGENPRCEAGLPSEDHEDDDSNRILKGEEPTLQHHRGQWAEGFHIYVLDWCRKSADIRRNSLVFEKALELVRSGEIAKGDDAALTSGQKLIVIGSSMGGVVSRHGLARMESEGTEHGVDLFVSLDAPQEGAYLPIGVQEANQFFINVAAGAVVLTAPLSLKAIAVLLLGDLLEIEQAEAVTQNETVLQVGGMNTQAALQLLLIHHSTFGNGSPALPRLSFAQELQDLGYPSREGIRNVAIASGSGAAVPLFRPKDDDEEDDDIPPLQRRVPQGFEWDSRPVRSPALEIPLRLTVGGKVIWSATLKAQVLFRVRMRVNPLVQAEANQEVFAFVLDTQPELRINGLRLRNVNIPSASVLAEELGIDERIAVLAGDLADDLLAGVRRDLQSFVDATLEELREVGIRSTANASTVYEPHGGGLGDKYQQFKAAIESGFSKAKIKGSSRGGAAPEVFIPTRSALGLPALAAGKIEDADIQNSPFDQVYFHQRDTGHVEFTDEVNGWLCQEVNDVLGEPYITSISPEVRPVQGTGFTLTVEGSNFNPSSTIVWDADSATPGGRAMLATEFVSPQKLEALVPAALISELTPCLPGSFCGNPRAPGLHEPVLIKVDTPNPTTPAPAPRRSSTASVCTQQLSFDIQEVAVLELHPKQPTSLDEISVLYSDDWTTGCVPKMPRVDVNGSTVDVTTTGATGLCTFIFAAYELNFKVGPLPAGEYRMNIVDRRGDKQTEIGTFGFTVRNPQPEIVSLQPGVIAAASGDQELEVNGSGFVETDSVVQWNGQPIETTFVSNSSLTALVPASSLREEGTASVTVVSEDPVESRISNAVELVIEIPELKLSELEPASVPSGSGDALIVLRGDGFRPDSTVLWTGSFGAERVLDSTYVDRKSMTVVLAANELRTAATHLFAVARDDETTDPLSFKVVGEASAPVAITQAVVNAASFEDGVAPGSIATIFGVNLATAKVEADRFPIATDLGGARVMVNGLASPILFASENQINFQVPFEAVPGPASVLVEREGVAGPTAGMTVLVDAFGAFQYNRVAAVRDPVVIHQDGDLVTPDNPALPGETVTLFGTGIGSLTNPPATGEPAVANPLSECTGAPQAAVTALGGGELSVAVTFCGLTPRFAGLVQLNLRMPDEPMAGANSTLFLTFDGKLLSFPFATE